MPTRARREFIIFSQCSLSRKYSTPIWALPSFRAPKWNRTETSILREWYSTVKLWKHNVRTSNFTLLYSSLPLSFDYSIIVEQGLYFTLLVCALEGTRTPMPFCVGTTSLVWRVYQIPPPGHGQDGMRHRLHPSHTSSVYSLDYPAVKKFVCNRMFLTYFQVLNY